MWLGFCWYVFEKSTARYGNVRRSWEFRCWISNTYERRHSGARSVRTIVVAHFSRIKIPSEILCIHILSLALLSRPRTATTSYYLIVMKTLFVQRSPCTISTKLSFHKRRLTGLHGYCFINFFLLAFFPLFFLLFQNRGHGLSWW